MKLSIPNATIDYLADFVSSSRSLTLFDQFITTLNWQQREVVVFGRRYLQPRAIAWHGEPAAVYTYSGQTFSPSPLTRELLMLKRAVERATKTTFNSVLANLYRDGQDSMGFHADDEPELGENPVIASLSLGDTRQFVMRSRRKPVRYERFDLHSGDLLVMRGRTQVYWHHGIPKTTRALGPRLNLTFRQIQPR